MAGEAIAPAAVGDEAEISGARRHRPGGDEGERFVPLALVALRLGWSRAENVDELAARDRAFPPIRMMPGRREPRRGVLESELDAYLQALPLATPTSTYRRATRREK